MALYHAAVQNPHSPLAVAEMLASLRGHVRRTDQCPDVTVLENLTFALRCFLERNIDHGPPQVVGPNHLVGEEQPKRGVDRAQEAIAEIRLLPGLHRVDVGGPEDIDAREAGRE